LSRSARIATIVAAALLGTYLLAALVVPRVVNADAWRSQVESRLSDLAGRKVSLDTLRLSLWTGVEIRSDGIRVGGEPGTAELEAGGVSVRPRLLPLLRGTPRLRSFRIEDATLRSSSGEPFLARASLSGSVRPAAGGSRVTGVLGGRWGSGDGPAVSARFDATARSGDVTLESLSGALGPARITAEGQLTGLDGGARRLRLAGTFAIGATEAKGTATVELRPGRPELVFEVHSPLLDFDEIARAARLARPHASASLSLVPQALAAEPAGTETSVLASVVGSGRVTADRGRLVGVEITKLASDVRIAGGDLRFEGASFDVHGGKARGDVVVGTYGAKPFRVAGHVDGVAVAPLVTDVAPDAKGGVSGTASLDLDVSGDAAGRPILRTLRGDAKLAVRDGKLETFGMLAQVRAVLEMAGGRVIGKDETPFERLTASAAIADGTARTQDLQFRSPDLDLDGGGTVDLEGPIKLQVLASFSREATADLLQRTPQLKIRVGQDGRLTVPLALRGTMFHPQVKLDLDRVLQEGLRQQVKDLGAKSLLKKLLGKEKD
jgi:hypothetical protein